MGNSASRIPEEGQGHPALFYRGVEAAQVSRFTTSELYFVQALEGHPARNFWDVLMNSVLNKDTTAAAAAAGATEEAEDVDEDAPFPAAVSTPVPREGGAEHHDAADKPPPPVPPLSSCCTVPDGMVEGEELDVEDAEDGKAGDGPEVRGSSVPEIFLPLNAQLASILDFYRLLADISMAYLNLLPTTPHKEKVTGLAAHYCLLTLSHTQVLLHCLTLWKEEKLGDGLGFIDYAKTRKLNFASVNYNDDEHDDRDTETQSSRSGKDERRTMSRTASVLFTMALAEANCRYYYISFLTNYSNLLMESFATSTERRRQNRIYANALDHLDAAYTMVRVVAQEYPNEYVAQLIFAHYPTSAAGAARDTMSSMGTGTSAGTEKCLCFANDHHRHMFLCGTPWSPTQSALIPLALARNVHLSVQEDVSRRAQADLLSPAQRLCHHYYLWKMRAVFRAIPGCSLYLLERALPGFKPGPATMLHDTSMEVAPSEPADVAAVRNDPLSNPLDGLAAASSEAIVVDVAVNTPPRRPAVKSSSAEYKAFMRHCKEVLRRGDRILNTDLNLGDERTCVMLCQSEAAMVCLASLFTAFELRIVSGQSKSAAPHGKALMDLVRGLFGPTSAVLHMSLYLLETGSTD
ncbi:hypothetical protein NESM_000259600 [Novymonas esmeraldas]|uniref:Uncharacterized protein n=1 Tax=Novymonas esmeraldas TaxID=1808958 RepID=A0AAW0FAV6_9TRYP